MRAANCGYRHQHSARTAGSICGVAWRAERRPGETCADITVVTSAGRSRPVTAAATVPAQSVLSDVVNMGPVGLGQFRIRTSDSEV